MKRYLLLGVLVLMFASMSTATTPVKRSDAKVNRTVPLQRVAMPQVKHEVMSMRTPGSPVVNKAPRRDEVKLRNWYDRPAGAFYVDAFSVDGKYGYSYDVPFLFMKPFKSYTYRGHVVGANENTHTAWDIFKYDGEGNCYQLDDVMKASVTYDLETSVVPSFYVVEGDLDDANSNWYVYQKGVGFSAINDPSEPPVVSGVSPFAVYSIPSDLMISGRDDVDYWASSKTMVVDGPGGSIYPYISYSGAKPAPGNEAGWWFGKNGAHIDGIAQAFEKPTSPYLLKKIGMYTTSMKLNSERVKMTCKVYRLPYIPPYFTFESAFLSEYLGVPIVTGEAIVSEYTIHDNFGFVEFTLYSHDEDDPSLTFEYTPTIDYPILVVIDGYNDNAGIQDFSACISRNYMDDEGYGELAYIKYPINVIHYDENGDTVFGEDGNPVYDFTGHYYWAGLNNFFSIGTMKTGLTIFLSTENPFIVFNYSFEDGEYTFPEEGGIMSQPIEVPEGTYPFEGIDFYSWFGSDDYIMTWNGDEELPDWLDIELEDVSGDEENGWEVQASVTAEPLPEHLNYREAVVRFEIPGDYIDYKFKQGRMILPPHTPNPDVNRDGEVTVADANIVINFIVTDGGSNDNTGWNVDANCDYEISVADVNYIIGVITGQIPWP